MGNVIVNIELHFEGDELQTNKKQRPDHAKRGHRFLCNP